MCSLAHPRAALGSGATAFLDRRRGVAAVAPGVMARESAHHVGAGAGAEGFSGLTHKRSRKSFDSNFGMRVGLDVGEVSIAPAPAAAAAQQQQRLQDRMKAELEAVRDLRRKALILCRGDAHTANGEPRFSAAGLRRRREAPLEAAAKRSRTTSPSKPATEAAYHQIKEPPKKQQQAIAQHAAPPRELQERLVTSKARELMKRRRQEEIARAREKCRRVVLEMERAALPDETIYPKDLEELGIAPVEYVVTRTRKQAERDGSIPCSLVGFATTGLHLVRSLI